MTPDKKWWYKQFVLAVADLAEEVKALGELHDSSTRNRIALRGELADLAKDFETVAASMAAQAKAIEALRKEVEALRERAGAVETRLPKPSDEPSFVGGGV